uniref:YBD domain-containing protein n=1 Tax=Macrostomum lignano TaxID=282301 RepID=A0A1I8F2D0_9PLAT
RHIFAHINCPMGQLPESAIARMESVDQSQIADKFPAKRGLNDFFDKGRSRRPSWSKIWADINTTLPEDHPETCSMATPPCKRLAGITLYESQESMNLSFSTKVCSFGKQVVEKVEKHISPHSENGKYIYQNERIPMCEYMINFISKLRQLPEKFMMNSVLENFTIMQVVTNTDTGEPLLCIAYVFEVSSSVHGAQRHIYRLPLSSLRSPLKLPPPAAADDGLKDEASGQTPQAKPRRPARRDPQEPVNPRSAYTMFVKEKMGELGLHIRDTPGAPAQRPRPDQNSGRDLPSADKDAYRQAYAKASAEYEARLAAYKQTESHRLFQEKMASDQQESAKKLAAPRPSTSKRKSKPIQQLGAGQTLTELGGVYQQQQLPPQPVYYSSAPVHQHVQQLPATTWKRLPARGDAPAAES